MNDQDKKLTTPSKSSKDSKKTASAAVKVENKVKEQSQKSTSSKKTTANTVKPENKAKKAKILAADIALPYDLHNLSSSFSTSKTIKTRRGRGISAGKGKTCGRGTKGQNARGKGVRSGFEGGQNPVYRRLPKRGFYNIHATKVLTVDVSLLAKTFANNSTVDIDSMLKAKILKFNLNKPICKIKILGNQPIDKKLHVKAHLFTSGAKQSIENAGGKCEQISL